MYLGMMMLISALMLRSITELSVWSEGPVERSSAHLRGEGAMQAPSFHNNEFKRTHLLDRFFRCFCFCCSETSKGIMSFEIADGKGPRWIGDNFEIPPQLQYAQDLPPKVTDSYVFFFGYDRPEKECCLQQWYPSPFVEDGKKFHTSEQYMMYRE